MAAVVVERPLWALMWQNLGAAAAAANVDGFVAVAVAVAGALVVPAVVLASMPSTRLAHLVGNFHLCARFGPSDRQTVVPLV